MARSACTFILCVVFAIIPVISMSCSDGSFPDENRKCVPCPQHCLFCESSTKCLSCESGFWGTVCEKPCSMCRTDTICEKTTGFCLVACRDGYSGVLCEDLCDSKCSSCNRTNKQVCLECATGTYPPVSCDNFCSTCDKTTCDKSGVCTYGCQRGYVGLKCVDKETSSLVLILIIVAVALTVVITTVIVVIFIWRKRRSNNSRYNNDKAPEAVAMMDKETAETTTNARKEASKNVRKSKKGQRSKKQTSKIQDKLYDLALSIQKKTDDVLKAEWDKLPTDCTKLCKECQAKHPPGKFEKQKLGPYEFNKVTVDEKNKSHYFNASYITVNFPPTEENQDAFNKLPREEKRRKASYIACIGPTKEYNQRFDIFWKMVWQENCQMIVMLNTLKEKSKEQYWPNVRLRRTYGQISVHCQTEQPENGFTIRIFILKNGSEERLVNHFHYSDWSEGRGLKNTKDFLEFCKKVKSGRPNGSGPILVHGRAGIGRTGTFIALDFLWKTAEDMVDSVDKQVNQSIDIQIFVENLRKQRVSMVETLDQYKFLHEAFAQIILNMLDLKGYQAKDA